MGVLICGSGKSLDRSNGLVSQVNVFGKPDWKGQTRLTLPSGVILADLQYHQKTAISIGSKYNYLTCISRCNAGWFRDWRTSSEQSRWPAELMHPLQGKPSRLPQCRSIPIALLTGSLIRFPIKSISSWFHTQIRTGNRKSRTPCKLSTFVLSETDAVVSKKTSFLLPRGFIWNRFEGSKVHCNKTHY